MSPETTKPILNVTKLVKRFGGFYALDGLSFHVVPGEILGLVGPNGSGKTTAINVISGLYAPDGGEVTFDGASIGGIVSHRLVHNGINRTFQVPKPFMSLTVRENVKVALAYGRPAVAPPTVADLLEEYRLAEFADRPASELNSAQQKMLDLTRALATRPRLLLLDELAAGLNPAELDWIAGRIQALAASGVAIIVVEHLMGFIEHITDRVIVLNAGKEIFEGKLAAAVKEPQVIEVFLEASMPPDATSLLDAKGIEAGYGTMQVLWGVDLDVRAGETVLLLGANGAGKTTFLKSLVGLVQARNGVINLGGEDITRMRSSDRMRRGMTYMSELAVFPDLTIEENIRIGAQALGHADPDSRMDELYELFPVLREKRRQLASSLSGGQRKMLGVAKALSAEPKLLVMDEPSAGLSPLFVKEVIRVLSGLQGRGLALLIAEQNISFLEVATRVFVLEGGHIRFSGTVAEMSGNEDLHRAYFGLK